MPASTAWPILLAFGITLLFASLVTSIGVGIAGFLLIACGVVGWAKQCLPEEHHEMIPVKARQFMPSSVRTQVAHIQVSEVHRAFLPVESYAVTSGLRGGIAGGIVMIFPRPPLRLSDPAQHLVRGESAWRRGRRALDKRYDRRHRGLPLEWVDCSNDHPCGSLHTHRPALRSNAANVATATDPSWRNHCSAPLDWPSSLDPRICESGVQRQNRVGLVRSLRDTLRHRSRRRRYEIGKNQNSSNLAVHSSYGNRSQRVRRPEGRWAMKFTAKTILTIVALASVVGCLGCDRKIGPPNDQEELMRPENVTSFDRLYKQNCSACHGENGSGGPALDLADPNYQALVDDASLRRWITSGMPGTQMPSFGEPAGGFLTQQQVDVLVAGMRTRWNHKDQNAADMPPYSSNAVGNVEHGQDVSA